MDPAPAEDSLLVADGVGGLKDSGVALASARQWAHPPIVATIDDADSPFTILAEHAGGIIRVDTSNDFVELNMPPSLAATVPFRIGIELIDGGNGAQVTSDGSLVFYPNGTTEADVGSEGITWITMTDATRASVLADLMAIEQAASALFFATAAAASASNAASALGVHVADTDNPHEVTPEQIGAATTGALSAVSAVANAAAPLLTTQVEISVSRALTDADAGKILICDTSAGAIVLTLPETIANRWNALVIREGANTASVVGSGGMLLKGPAAVSDTVTIGVDDGAVTLVHRSATRCLAYGVVA